MAQKYVSNSEIEKHLPLVKTVTRILSNHRGCSLDFEDIYQAGCIGLLAAMRNFDKSKGVGFNTYASRRISGAILDQIREVYGRKGRAKLKAHYTDNGSLLDLMGKNGSLQREHKEFSYVDAMDIVTSKKANLTEKQIDRVRSCILLGESALRIAKREGITDFAIHVSKQRGLRKILNRVEIY